MPMKNPAHPGRLIKTALDDLRLSVTVAAEGLGVTRQHLNNVIAGRSSITPEMALRLEAGIGSTAETWINLQKNYDLAQLRRGRAVKVKRLAPAVA